jgi:hypothetical protein
MSMSGFVACLLSALFLVITPGCYRKNEPVALALHEPLVAASPYLLVDEAKLVDIPIPLYAQPREIPPLDHDGQSSPSLVVTFTVRLSYDDVLAFYHAEMEHVGWRERRIIKSVRNITMVYEKPHKICIISLQQHSASREITASGDKEILISIGPQENCTSD